MLRAQAEIDQWFDQVEAEVLPTLINQIHKAVEMDGGSATISDEKILPMRKQIERLLAA
ncbi:MAG: hypothetical protein HOP19_03080 [Acidobacteria bacterium]|nr:hypothetical protein [Acidobacteriota bacterium]